MAFGKAATELFESLYQFPSTSIEMRWASPENLRARKHNGGQENAGRKGAPWVFLEPGQAVTTAEEDAGMFGTIRRLWMTFEREDDFSSCAYFYLDRPASDLPPLAPLSERVTNLLDEASSTPEDL